MKINVLIKTAAGDDWFKKFTHTVNNVGGAIEPYLRHGSKLGKTFGIIGALDSGNQLKSKNFLGAGSSFLGASNPLFGAVTTGNSLGKDVYQGGLKNILPKRNIANGYQKSAPLGKGINILERVNNKPIQGVKPTVSKMQIKSPTQNFVGPSIKGLSITRGSNSQWNSKTNMGNAVSQKN